MSVPQGSAVGLLPHRPRGAGPLVTWFFRGRLHADLRFCNDFGGWRGWGWWSFDGGRGLRSLKCFFRVRTPDGERRGEAQVRQGPGLRSSARPNDPSRDHRNQARGPIKWSGASLEAAGFPGLNLIITSFGPK